MGSVGAVALLYTFGLTILGFLIALAIAKPSTRRATVPAAIALGVLLAFSPGLLCLGLLLTPFDIGG